MWKRILQIALLSAVVITAIFSIYKLVAKTPNQLQTTASPAQTNSRKQIVIDAFKKEIRFYNDGKLTKTLTPDEERKYQSLYRMTAGKYSSAQMNLGAAGTEIMEFAEQSTEIVVLNEPNIGQENAVDDQSFYFTKSKNGKAISPKTNADAILVADIDTGSIIFQKEKDKRLPIASISKLMTALIAIDEMDKYKTVTITKEVLSKGYGSSGSLRSEQKLTVGELMYPLLLPSSNDAAIAISKDYGEENFVKEMNNRAVTLGMSNTSFAESSGISPKNISSVEDLFLLAKHIYKTKREIFDITKLKSVNLWRSSGAFAGNESYLGGKTGYTEEANETSIAIFSLPLSENGDKNRNIAIIVLHSNNYKNDTTAIIKWLGLDIVFREKTEPEETFTKQDVENFLKEEQTISMLAVGDIMMDRGVEESVSKNGNGDFLFLFQKTNFLKDADITFGNLEGPASDAGADLKNLYSFRMNPMAIGAIKEAGFDIVSLANNHIGDWGRPAFDDTMSRLKNENILFAGAGEKMTNAVEPTIIEKGDAKIGFLAFSDVGPNGLKAGESKSGILIVDENFDNIIKNASQKVDILVASIHFGDEYQTTSNARQKDLAHSAIDNGAKIVIGHHPHVSQEIENYKDGLIAYSLGNFIFDQNFSDNTMSGLALKITISGNGKIRNIEQIKTKLNKFYQPEEVK